jgi:hypothetical protein
MQDLRAIRFIEGTKVSHDYEGSDVVTFSYRDLVNRGIPAIGIPCKQNKIIIVDVDVEGVSHKNDGREFWFKLVKELNIPTTYSVSTPSGGFHFYYRLPEFINPDTFSPPGQLGIGVDLKWNGWAGAPPTLGYQVVNGNITQIAEIPQTLLDYISSLVKGKGTKTFEGKGDINLKLHKPFTEAQLLYIRTHVPFIQAHCALSRDEWRDGIFSLNAGIDDPEVLEELVTLWCMNKAYQDGDENVALEMANRADKHGGVGPATVLNIIARLVQSQSTPSTSSPWTVQEIFDKSRVTMGFDSKGGLKIETSESNAGALIGAMYPEDKLYYDSRTDLYIFNGESHSDTELVNLFIPALQSTHAGLGLDKFRKASVSSGLDVLMATRKRDPHEEYLKSLKWDGVRRIEKFFTYYVGAEDTEYSRLVGVNFWTSLAARGLRPGCKFDSMVVLEGHEGISKSSLVEAIGGEYTFASSRKDGLEHTDELRKMHQAVIVELPELMGLMGENAEKVKAVLAKPFDHIRGLFAKQAKKHNRGFVLFGTTNNTRYLTSAMGHRRFWPIRIPKHVKSVKLSEVHADRDQLFAEGIHMLYAGHEYWSIPNHLLDPVVEARVLDEPLMAPIRDLVANYLGSWGVHQIYRDLETQGYINKGYTSTTINRIEDSMRRLGFVEDEDGRWGKKTECFVMPMAQDFSGFLDCLI